MRLDPDPQFFYWRTNNLDMRQKVLAAVWENDAHVDGIVLSALVKLFKPIAKAADVYETAITLCKMGYLRLMVHENMAAMTSGVDSKKNLAKQRVKLAEFVRVHFHNCLLLEQLMRLQLKCNHLEKEKAALVKAKNAHAEEPVIHMPTAALIRAFGVPISERQWSVSVPMHHESAINPCDRIERIPDPVRTDSMTYVYTDRSPAEQEKPT